MIISLQTIFSFLHDDPRFYNPASYVVCGVLLAFWLARVVRSKCPEKTAWFALAPIGALSMLPVYHRLDDAKLLLLAVPVSAMLWRQGGAKARAGLLAVAGGIVCTAAIVWAVFFALLKLVRIPDAAWAHNLAIVVQVFPPPLALLGTGVFFLWIFCAQSDDQLAALAARTAAAKQ
jgi:hypothetical protein